MTEWTQRAHRALASHLPDAHLLALAILTFVPLTALAQEWLTKASEMGLGEHDFAVVFDVFAKMAGLPPSPKA